MEYHVIHSVPDSRMNRMEGNAAYSELLERISVLLGNFLQEILRGPSISQVTSDSISRSETCRSALFELKKFRVFCYS